MSKFDIDTELRKHTTPRAIADAKKTLANSVAVGSIPFGLARAYSEMELVGSTAALLLADEKVPENLKWTLFMAALAESARTNIQWGMNYVWLVPKTAQRSISQGLKTQQEIALLQLKKSVAALGLSE